MEVGQKTFLIETWGFFFSLGFLFLIFKKKLKSSLNKL